MDAEHLKGIDNVAAESIEQLWLSLFICSAGK